MKVLNISGGGTKIVGQYGALEALVMENGWKPDVITGISAGAILSIFVGMGLLPELKSLFLNLTQEHFFVRSPVTKNNKISLSAVWRILTLKKSLGDFTRLTALLKEYVSEDEFDYWRKSSDSPEVYVGSVSYTTGERRYWKLNDMEYETAMLAITASSSMPVFCEPVKMYHHNDHKYHYHFDGGMRDFIGSSYVIEKYGKKISEMINIFSKPLNNRIFKFDPDRTGNIVSIFVATLDIMQTEVSKSDENIIELLSEKYKIKSKNIYIPLVLHHAYDTDPTRLVEIYNKGKQAMLDSLKS